MKNLRFILFIGIIFAFLYSCTKEEKNDLADLSGVKKSLQIGALPDQFCNSAPQEFCLIAGQKMNSGKITMVNDQTNLYIKFETSAGISLKEVHVWIGDDLGNAPVNKQNTPVPGQFPYKMERINKSSVTLVIPLTEVPDDCFYILAHAALSNGETAWGSDCDEAIRMTFEEYFDTNRWGFIVKYCLASCDQVALKISYKDAAGNERNGVMDGDVKPFSSNWCSLLGISALGSESQTYKLYSTHSSSFGDEIGNVVIAKYADHFDVVINLDNGNVTRTYMYYGTLQGLSSDLYAPTGCPQFTNWKIPGTSAPSQISFSVPIL